MLIGDRDDWTLHDDSKPWPDDTLMQGPETVIKALYYEVLRTGQVAEADAYIEDPNGNQFAWNRHTLEWNAL
jgi:hypothetical protein